MTAVLPEVALARIVVPEPVTSVVVEMFALGATVHAPFDETATTCGLATWPFWTVPTGRALRLRPTFCPECFPDPRRCVFCGFPSGDIDECGLCFALSAAVDKAVADS